MRSRKAVVEDYGWRGPQGTCAHEYLERPIVRILQRLGLRKILDLGCGNGALTHALSRAGFDVLGCDADERGIEIARSRGGRFKVLSVYDDPAALGENGFDGVIAVEVIEHLFLPSALPTFARVVLKPKGYLLLSTPYHGYLKNLALSVVNGWDRHFHPSREGGHIKFWSRKTLSEFLASHGFEVTEFHGAGRWPFLWKSMILVGRARPTSAD